MAMAMILGRKIWRMPISRIIGFFSGSIVDDAGERGAALKRSRIAMFDQENGFTPGGSGLRWFSKYVGTP